MSENQPEKRGRGRPRNPDLVALPHMLRKKLEQVAFFDAAVPQPQPPRAAEFSLRDRFCATFVRYCARPEWEGDVEQAAAALRRSWRQITRYLSGGTIPVPLVYALAGFAGVSQSWVLTGIATTAQAWDPHQALDHLGARAAGDAKPRRRATLGDKKTLYDRMLEPLPMSLEQPYMSLEQKGGPLDVTLLARVISGVETWLSENLHPLAPERKAEIVARLYQFALEDRSLGTEPLDLRRIAQFLRLAL